MVTRADPISYGMVVKCNRRTAIGRELARPIAHSDGCRDHIMSKIAGDGVPEGRVKVAIEKAIRRNEASVEFLEGETRDFEEEIMKETEARPVNTKLEEHGLINREQQLGITGEMEIVLEFHQVINRQCRHMIRRRDAIGNQLEAAFQRAKYATIPLRVELGSVMAEN